MASNNTLENRPIRVLLILSKATLAIIATGCLFSSLFGVTPELFPIGVFLLFFILLLPPKSNEKEKQSFTEDEATSPETKETHCSQESESTNIKLDQIAGTALNNLSTAETLKALATISENNRGLFGDWELAEQARKKMKEILKKI